MNNQTLGIATASPAPILLPADRLMSIREAMEYAKCHENTLYLAIKSGRLKVVGRVGRRYRISKRHLDQYLAKGAESDY